MSLSPQAARWTTSKLDDGRNKETQISRGRTERKGGPATKTSDSQESMKVSEGLPIRGAMFTYGSHLTSIIFGS